MYIIIYYLLLFGYTLQGTTSPTPSINVQKKWRWWRWCGTDIITGNLCPIPAHTYRAIMPESKDPRIDAAVADDWCWGAETESEAIAGDGRCSTQGAAEYWRV